VVKALAYIELSKKCDSSIKILIFAEGTILKPKSIFTIYNHKSYLPIGNCIEKINGWHRQGAEILYCTSRKNNHAIEIADILRRYGFAGTKLFFREKGQKYKDIVELIKPNILIEDNCKSIGGSWQMCITYVQPLLKETIKSIIVKEFKGIDHLSQSINDLQQINECNNRTRFW